MKSTVHGEKLIEHTCHGHSDVTSDNAVTARNAFGCPWLDGLEYPIAQRVVAGLGGVPHSDLGFLDGKPVPGSGGEQVWPLTKFFLFTFCEKSLI